MRSPDKPWVKGAHPTYTAFDLRVSICVDEHGNVWSEHDFDTPADGGISIELPQGGAPQVAHALLTEAVRREVFMCALIEQMKEPGFVARWKEASDEDRIPIERVLAEATHQVVARTLPKMVPGAVAEVLTMMSGVLDQSGGPGEVPLG